MFLSLLLATMQVQDSAYFQQGVEYRIEATLDETTSVLR
jgi:hypothetical protein